MDITPIARWQVAYDVNGEGTPVLLIMGFTMPGGAWRFQVRGLAAQHRTITYDHPGLGGSGPPPGPRSMSEMAAVAAGLLDHLDMAGAHVVGVSMGGMIAQHVALRHSERVRSLTLIATHAGGLGARLPTLRGLGLFAAGLLAPRAWRLRVVERLLFPRQFRQRCDRAWLDDILQRDFTLPIPKSVRRAQLRAVMGHDTRERLGELEGIPTLIVCPGRDILIDPAQTRRLYDRIPNARVVDFPDAGHGIIRQCHDVLNGYLLRHFAAAEAA